MVSRTTTVRILSALALVGAAHAQHGTPRNESCSHAEGTCSKPQHVTAGLPLLLVGSDQALLGHIDMELDSAAMRPAAFPSFLPADSLGASALIDLPQPRLTRRDVKNSSTQGAAPLMMGSLGGAAMDALGLF